jgi:hypothetical protein
MMQHRPGSEPITKDDLDEALAIHSAEEQKWFHEEIGRVLRAFPDGVEAHRTAHEAMIKAAAAEEEFWRGLKADIAHKSIWGILQILLILTAAGLAAKFGLALPLSK